MKIKIKMKMKMKKQNKEHSHGMDVKWRSGYWRNTVIIVSAVVSAVTLQLFNTKRSGTVCSQSSTHICFQSGPQLRSMDHHWTTVFSSRVGNWRLTSHPYMYVWHSIISSLTCTMTEPDVCCVWHVRWDAIGLRFTTTSHWRWVSLYVCKSWLSYMWVSVG